MAERPFRVMWLLNHSTARKFELPQLKRNGITEIFMPKKLVQNVIFRSANVDWSEDANLTIPASDLKKLNEVDWYDEIPEDIWPIVNKHFDMMFFIFVKPAQFMSFAKHFKGILIWRVYGRELNQSYSAILSHYFHGLEDATLTSLGRRFWLGEAYEHLHEIERTIVKDRALFLPLGLANAEINDKWTGEDKRAFFVCPDIGVASYYRDIYNDFKENFKGIPHLIGGNQPIKLPDETVLGYVPLEQHEHNMRAMRVMYYHSSEPNHIHYHPFEAIRAGMPLVFMGHGILDRFGGKSLPGRVANAAQGRTKVKRILDGDKGLIDDIRASQSVLLEPMKPANCEQAWTDALTLARAELAKLRRQERPASFSIKKKPRIAVILPLSYRGGTLRATKLVAKALYEGSRLAKEDVDVVLGHIDNREVYKADDFDDLAVGIARRPFTWTGLSTEKAKHAMRYARTSWQEKAEKFIIPDDGMQQFTDCDAWVFISDRVSSPILPLKPYTLVVFDYLQRYQEVLNPGDDIPFLKAAHRAERVFVTTRQTEMDALQYANLPREKVVKLPMLVPDFSDLVKPSSRSKASSKAPPYFIWTTNLAPHKNHINAIRALQFYYSELGGTLECYMTGVNTQFFKTADLGHIVEARNMVNTNRVLSQKLKIMGDLDDRLYQQTLQESAFLWHPAVIDNGTFSVIEAAQLGVPSLSGDYSAMREINDRFSLNLQWMDTKKPREMAEQLKRMEIEAGALRKKLPSAKKLKSISRDPAQAIAYWKAIKSCL